MQYAIFSDVHSNLESLKSLLRFLGGRPEVMPLCLGDAVGYAARPNECLALLRENQIPLLMGNHDYAANYIQERLTFNEYALQAIHWQDTVLTPEHKEMLRRLPLSMVIENRFAVTHADFSDPAGFVYIASAWDARLSFEALPAPVGFYGHTHIPTVLTQDPRLPESAQITGAPLVPDRESIQLDPELRYLINPGSLGQPRDGDPRASFVIFDAGAGTVTFHRLPYDYEEEARAVRDAGLPDFLAGRLIGGY